MLFLSCSGDAYVQVPTPAVGASLPEKPANEKNVNIGYNGALLYDHIVNTTRHFYVIVNNQINSKKPWTKILLVVNVGSPWTSRIYFYSGFIVHVVSGPLFGVRCLRGDPWGELHGL